MLEHINSNTILVNGEDRLFLTMLEWDRVEQEAVHMNLCTVPVLRRLCNLMGVRTTTRTRKADAQKLVAECFA